MNPIVIVGGGHAAAPLCAALTEAGLGAQLHLVCAEPQLPYQRPPLSKAYLKNADEALQAHRSDAWYAQAGITLHQADPALAIDRAAQQITLRSGTTLAYSQLVLATGTRARRLPQLPQVPGGLANVALLRDVADAQRLRGLLAGAKALTVLGGGFIGLEVAATARAKGLQVQVLEVAPRLLGRSVSAELAAHVLATHQAGGIDVQLGVVLGGFEHDGQRLQAITVNGQRQPVDLVLVGIGAEPDDGLARAAGLVCDNGIVVDVSLRSSDPLILAIGDVARFPVAPQWLPSSAPAGSTLRLESVQNATDQARCAALTLQGQHPVYAALPWFWSEQGSMRLQMAGLMPAPDAPGVSRHRRPGANPGSFSILHYQVIDQVDRLLCVESANAPMDHVMSRKLMDAGKHPPPAQACDPAVALKTLLG